MRKGVKIVSRAEEPTHRELRTSTRLDRGVLEKIGVSMDACGYGSRQRSKWINEALEQYARAYRECPDDEKVLALRRSTALSENGEYINVVLRQEALDFIEGCRSFMALQGDDFEEGSQSRVIHLAITLRLIQERLL